MASGAVDLHLNRVDSVAPSSLAVVEGECLENRVPDPIKLDF